MKTPHCVSASLAVAGLAGLAVIAAPRAARADTVVVVDEPEGGYREYESHSSIDLAFDGEGAIPLMDRRFQSGNDLSGGGGFKFRLGDQIRFPRMRVTPEIGYGYDHLFATDVAGA